MAILPKSNINLPINSRKKAAPGIKPVELPALSKKEDTLPKTAVHTEKVTPVRVKPTWEKNPIEATEHFGCCSSHLECTEARDCVKKDFIINYDKHCGLYKLLMKRKEETK